MKSEACKGRAGIKAVAEISHCSIAIK